MTALRRPAVAAALAAFVVFLVGIMVIEPLPVGVARDDGMYVMLAKSLATGQGYRWLNLPGAPPATHFPPGYPALLSLVWRVFPAFPANVLVFKALNAVLLAVAAAGLVIFATRRLGYSPLAAALVSVIGCIAVPTLVLSTLVMSEMLFLALLLPLLLLAERVADGQPRTRSAILLGACVAALVLVRTHGIALAGAVGLVLLLRRRWRELAAFCVAFAVCIAPWQLWQSHHMGIVPPPLRGNYESYGSWLARGFGSGGLALAGRTVARTSFELFGNFAVMAGAGMPMLPRVIAAIATVALLALGVWRLRHRSLVACLFLCAYLAIVVLWPFAPARFVWGIWPLVTLVVATGAIAVWDWMPLRTPLRVTRYAALAATALVACGYGLYTARGYRGHWWSSIPRQVAELDRPLVQWVLRNTRPTDVVATNAEPLVFLYTGRRSVPVGAFSADEYFTPPAVASRTAELRSILQAYPATIVAILSNDSIETAARGLAAARPPMLTLRDSMPHGLIFTSTPSPP